MKTKYGICPKCGSELNPVWFTEEETRAVYGIPTKTGKKRTACSHLECSFCCTNVCVDDTYDGNWY